jgi:hypothetical protein
VYQDEDGMVTIRGRLDPEVGALLVQALAAARETLYQQARDKEREADSPTMVRPDGQLLPEVPPPPEVPDDPVRMLRARHDADGLRLHARTATPGWVGERLDVGWAIDVLHPLARRCT